MSNNCRVFPFWIFHLSSLLRQLRIFLQYFIIKIYTLSWFINSIVRNGDVSMIKNQRKHKYPSQIFRTISSENSNNSYFLINGWLSIFFIVILLFGSFYNVEFMKSFMLFDPSYILKLSVTIFAISDLFLIWKGFYPVKSSWVKIPMAQISIFSSYSFPFKS